LEIPVNFRMLYFRFTAALPDFYARHLTITRSRAR
jgi:hypothetical protein